MLSKAHLIHVAAVSTVSESFIEVESCQFKTLDLLLWLLLHYVPISLKEYHGLQCQKLSEDLKICYNQIQWSHRLREDSQIDFFMQSIRWTLFLTPTPLSKASTHQNRFL